jgi:chemotaxis protein MotB
MTVTTNTSTTNRLLVFTLGVALMAMGCVTKGSYETLQSELDRNRLEAERLMAENADLNAQLEATQVERDVMVANLSLAEEKVNSLEGTYGALVDELRSEVASGQIKVRQVANGIQVELAQEILFPSGGSELAASGRSVIERVGGQIRTQQSRILVEGHSDNVKISSSLQKRFPSNWELAGARAASVVRILSEAGVDPTRLQAVSRGPFAPIASNDTAEGRAQNRRIEILLRPEVQ